MLRLIKRQQKLFMIFLLLGLVLTRDLFAQDKIIAVVNNEVITAKDLEEFINFTRIQLAQEYKGKELEDKIQSLKPDLLDKLIEDRLILQEAKKSTLHLDERRVRDRISEMKARYPSEVEFQDALKRQGFVQADIENKIKEQFLMYMIVNSEITSKITVNPTEVTAYYQKNLSQFRIPEQREFISIALDSQGLASDIYAKLKAGQSPEDLGKKYALTVDKFRAAQRGQLRKDIEEIIFKLQKGEVAKPLKLENKYYIFMFLDIIPSQQQDLAEAQGTIYSILTNNKMKEALNKWLDEIKSRSYIKITHD